MDEARAVVPGLAVVIVIAFAAMHLGEHYSAPVMLYALLLGLALHFLAGGETNCLLGIEFASKRLLRLGVALLGLQISIPEILALGVETLVIVVASTSLTIGFGIVAARLLGRSMYFGVLTGGAVAICGASAAIAIAAVLQRKVEKVDLLFTVAAVTTLSTVAMILYPLLIVGLGLDDRPAGILLGGTIHDVAQVVGAGYAVSESTGHIATTVKLLRVALLLPVVMIVAWCIREPIAPPRASVRLVGIPGFVVGFAALVVLNSMQVVPPFIHETTASLSRWLLVMAISAIGMLTSLKSMANLGFQHVVIIVGETVWLLAIVSCAILFSRV